METKKIRIRPEGADDYGTVLHPETSADQVKITNNAVGDPIPTVEEALIFRSDTPPEGVVEGRLWLDTSDNTFQENVLNELPNRVNSVEQELNTHQDRVDSVEQELNAHLAETVTKAVLVTEPHAQTTKTTIYLGFRPKLLTIEAIIRLTKYESYGAKDEGLIQHCKYTIVDSDASDAVSGSIIRFNKDSSNNNYISGSVSFTETGIEIDWASTGNLGLSNQNRRLIITAITHGGV